MKAREVIQMIPKKFFTFLSKKYEVDYKVKKLPGETVFLVMLETLFSSLNHTLRALATQFNEKDFQQHILRNKEYITIDHTAFHYRLNKIDSEYFRELFERAKKIYAPYLTDLNKKYSTWIFDSTVVTLSSNLLKQCGFRTTGSKKKNQIKYTIGYHQIPEVARLYTEKKYNGENPALGETILTTEIPKKSIILFDRGLQSRTTYDKITEKGNLFISRLNKVYKADIITEHIPRKNTNITQEKEGYLYERKGKKTRSIYRIIHLKPPNSATKQPDKKKKNQISRRAHRSKNSAKTTQELIEELVKEEIIFVTNISRSELSAEEIAEIYKERWKIEVFFKFLKQELHFSHLINRTENGIKSVMYITLIYALILLVYKRINQLEGYKYVKMKFMLEAKSELKQFLEPIVISHIKRDEALPKQHW